MERNLFDPKMHVHGIRDCVLFLFVAAHPMTRNNGQNNDSQRCPRPHHQNPWICDFNWLKDRAGMMMDFEMQ